MKFAALTLKLLLAATPCYAAIDVVCDNRFSVTEGSDTLYARYCSNVDDLFGSSSLPNPSTITNAVIVVHGNSRNADDYLSYVEQAGALVDPSAYASTVILAPQFITDEDIAALNLDSTNLYWSSGGWKKGNTSNSNPYSRPFTISSFAIVDQMISSLASAAVYPNLSQLTLVGHSAGGQFVHRYAAGGSGQDLVSPTITFQYVVANPSSYLYFSNLRAEQNSGGTVFSIPDAATHVYDATSCVEYNDYKYGLDGLNNYMTSVGVTALEQNYQSRNVVVFLGENDTSRSGSLDVSCEGDLQGDNRFERGITFYYHALEEFGLASTVKVAPGIAHSGSGMIQSPCGLALLFDHNTNACPNFAFSTASPTLSPFPSSVPSTSPTGMPTIVSTTNPTVSCSTGQSCSPNCCVGESCVQDSDCQLNDCSSGKPSSRVCLGPAGPLLTPVPTPSASPPPTATLSPTPNSCGEKNDPCAAPTACCSGNCRNNGKCSG